MYDHVRRQLTAHGVASTEPHSGQFTLQFLISRSFVMVRTPHLDDLSKIRKNTRVTYND